MIYDLIRDCENLLFEFIKQTHFIISVVELVSIFSKCANLLGNVWCCSVRTITNKYHNSIILYYIYSLRGCIYSIHVICYIIPIRWCSRNCLPFYEMMHFNLLIPIKAIIILLQSRIYKQQQSSVRKKYNMGKRNYCSNMIAFITVNACHVHSTNVHKTDTLDTSRNTKHFVSRLVANIFYK